MSKQNGRFRNLMHGHPLLRKGGVHEKSNKAKRRSEKQALGRQCMGARSFNGVD